MIGFCNSENVRAAFIFSKKFNSINFKIYCIHGTPSALKADVRFIKRFKENKELL